MIYVIRKQPMLKILSDKDIALLANEASPTKSDFIRVPLYRDNECSSKWHWSVCAVIARKVVREWTVHNNEENILNHLHKLTIGQEICHVNGRLYTHYLKIGINRWVQC